MANDCFRKEEWYQKAVRVIVNGQPQDTQQNTLAALLEEMGRDPRGVAVAVNEEFVARKDHAQRALQTDDRIEVVAPMQGG